MLVETYEAISIDEATHGNEEVNEEALALIGSLGLAGQQELLSERAVGDGETVVTRNPYRKMTGEEAHIFRAILPREVDIKKYSDGPIPVRVLQIAAIDELALRAASQQRDAGTPSIGPSDAEKLRRIAGRQMAFHWTFAERDALLEISARIDAAATEGGEAPRCTCVEAEQFHDPDCPKHPRRSLTKNGGPND